MELNISIKSESTVIVNKDITLRDVHKAVEDTRKLREKYKSLGAKNQQFVYAVERILSGSRTPNDIVENFYNSNLGLDGKKEDVDRALYELRYTLTSSMASLRAAGFDDDTILKIFSL